MKKVLLIRRTKKYYENGIIGWKIHNFYPSMVKFWNFSFKMKYLQFRKKMTAIAQETFEQNNFDYIIPYKDVKRIKRFAKGTLLIPIDEDDFLSPNMISEIEKEFDNRNFYWDIIRVKSKGCILQRKGKDTYISESCSYGVKLPIDFSQIMYHWKFNRDNGKYIQKVYSLKIDTPGSISVLRRNPRTFEFCIKEIFLWLNYEYKIPNQFKIYFEKYIDLLKELLESCRLPYEYLV